MRCQKARSSALPGKGTGLWLGDSNKFLTSLLAAVLILGACSSPKRDQEATIAAPSVDALAARVTSLADEYVRDYIAAFPEQVAALGLPSAANDRLSDNSLDGLRAWQVKEDGWAGELGKIDGGLLWGRPEWLTYGFLREALESSHGLRRARAELWPVNQMSGWQAGFAQLAAIQPVGTPELRTQALARWRMLPAYLDNELANLKEGLRLGYTTPKRNVQLVIVQLDSILAASPSNSPFFSPAQRDPESAFRAAWERLLSGEIHAAVQKYRDFLKNEYLPEAREAIGVSALPGGVESYREALRYFTSLDRSAEETYRLGEQYVAKYEAEASEIGLRLFGTADLAVIREQMANDPSNHFRSREELLNISRDAVFRARRAMPDWFNALPKADVVVEPVPSYLERTASSGYESGSLDGSRPGTYRINLYQAENQTRAGAEITAFHETYPGHHFQISIAMELPKAHMITLLSANSGYIEGWARYSEALVEEMGLYTTEFARINRRLWPAHGMVVDPGIHVMGWTRDQAIRYVSATGRFSSHEAESLVDRIVAWPGQLTAYDTGAIEIFALREKAKKELGDRFDIRAFHDQLLKYGSVTLPMLREIIDRWLADIRKGASR
jgi:uncharacterized protein (DUF885 family)